jgi:hypothetical protein
VAFLAAGRSGDLEQTLLVVGVVLLVGGIEFLDIVLLEDVSDHLLALDDEFEVSILVLALEGELLAVGDAVSHFEQFLGNFGDGEALALFDLST